MSITAQFVQEMKTKKSKKQDEIVKIDAAIDSANALGCKDTTVEKTKQPRKSKKKTRRPRLVPDSQNGLIRNIIRDDGPLTAKEAHKKVSGMTLHGVQCVISRLVSRKYLRGDGSRPATYKAI